MNCNIAHFCFLAGVPDDTRWQTVTRTNNGLLEEFTVSYQNLLPSTSYTFRVIAYNKYGISYPAYSDDAVNTLTTVVFNGSTKHDGCCIQPIHLSTHAHRKLIVDSKLRWLIGLQFCCVLIRKHSVNFHQMSTYSWQWYAMSTDTRVKIRHFLSHLGPCSCINLQ